MCFFYASQNWLAQRRDNARGREGVGWGRAFLGRWWEGQQACQPRRGWASDLALWLNP